MKAKHKKNISIWTHGKNIFTEGKTDFTLETTLPLIKRNNVQFWNEIKWGFSSSYPKCKISFRTPGRWNREEGWWWTQCAARSDTPDLGFACLALMKREAHNYILVLQFSRWVSITWPLHNFWENGRLLVEETLSSAATADYGGAANGADLMDGSCTQNLTRLSLALREKKMLREVLSIPTCRVAIKSPTVLASHYPDHSYIPHDDPLCHFQ